METVNTIVLVSVSAAINFVRSCGIRGVSEFAAVWLAKVISLGGLVPLTKGVILTDILAGPAIVVVGSKVCALMVPCGILCARGKRPACPGRGRGWNVHPHKPGSKWIATGAASPLPVAGFVTSLICWT